MALHAPQLYSNVLVLRAAMDELFLSCAEEFSSGNNLKACNLLLDYLNSSNELLSPPLHPPPPIPPPLLTNTHLMTTLLQHILSLLQSSHPSSPTPSHPSAYPSSHPSNPSSPPPDPSLQLYLLEILAWFFSIDFCSSPLSHKSLLLTSQRSQDLVHLILQYLLKILQSQATHTPPAPLPPPPHSLSTSLTSTLPSPSTSPSVSVIGHIYFILSTQAIPEIFSHYSHSFIGIIFQYFPKEKQNCLKKYALRALLNLFRCCPSPSLLTPLPLLELDHLDVINEWIVTRGEGRGGNEEKNNSQITNDEICEFINLWHGEMSQEMTNSVMNSSKKLMSQLRYQCL